MCSPFRYIEAQLVLRLIEEFDLNKKKLQEINISPSKLTLNQMCLCFLNIRKRSLQKQTWSDLKNDLPVNIIRNIFINCMFKLFSERILRYLGVYDEEYEKNLWFNIDFSCMNLKSAFDIYDFLSLSNYNIL